MRYIALWRKPGSAFDWEFYVSESETEATETASNLTRQGIKEARTYVLGDLVPNLCIGPDRLR